MLSFGRVGPHGSRAILPCNTAKWLKLSLRFSHSSIIPPAFIQFTFTTEGMLCTFKRGSVGDFAQVEILGRDFLQEMRGSRVF